MKPIYYKSIHKWLVANTNQETYDLIHNLVIASHQALQCGNEQECNRLEQLIEQKLELLELLDT